MYPDNMVQVSVRMYLYRWIDHAEDDPGNSHFQVSLAAAALVIPSPGSTTSRMTSCPWPLDYASHSVFHAGHY